MRRISKHTFVSPSKEVALSSPLVKTADRVVVQFCYEVNSELIITLSPELQCS